jgi:hypothetical protein
MDMLFSSTCATASSWLKEELLGGDGAEQVFIAVGEMRRATEALQVLVVGIQVEKVDREAGAVKNPAAEFLPVVSFVVV